MKRILMGLSALLMCILLTSCGSPADKLQGILDDMKANGKQWDAEQWESTLREVADLQISFWESNPTKQEIKAFDKLGDKFETALTKIMKSKRAQKAIEKASKRLEKDKEFKKLIKQGEKLEKKARKNASRQAEDDDEGYDDDDDYDDEDYDDDDDF